VQSFTISDRGKAKRRRSNRCCLNDYPGDFLDVEEKLTGCVPGFVAGIDEAGRGPLAGPVVASAVILDPDNVPPGINDSKKLSPRKRSCLSEEIKRTAISVGIGIVSARAIDRINILQATRWAMTEALLSLNAEYGCVIVDGRKALPEAGVPVIGMIKGDLRCVTVAAASIVAKVARDRLMDHMDVLYPRYRFCDHKGYGTRAHVEALRKYGPTRIHRLSFEPVWSVLGGGCEEQEV
jgi:ribonuclease HII